MFKTMMRRAAMMVALPALVAGSATAPALASSGDYKSDDYKVHVKVCKEVKGNYYKGKYDHDKHKGKSPKFKMYLSTSKDNYTYDDEYVKVKVDKCEDADLKYDSYSKKVTLKEYDIPYGYKFDTVRCYTKNGYGKYVYSSDYKVDPYYKSATCSFDYDYLKFVVVNKKDKDKDKY
jgi:hypothetical protein